MTRAARANPYLLYDKDRYGWSEIDHERRQRTRRREVVNTFLASRDYWKLMRWLAAKMPSHRRFLTIGEALAMARFEYDRCPCDERLMVVVVARYFNMVGRNWL